MTVFGDNFMLEGLRLPSVHNWHIGTMRER